MATKKTPKDVDRWLMTPSSIKVTKKAKPLSDSKKKVKKGK